MLKPARQEVFPLCTSFQAFLMFYSTGVNFIFRNLWPEMISLQPEPLRPLSHGSWKSRIVALCLIPNPMDYARFPPYICSSTCPSQSWITFIYPDGFYCRSALSAWDWRSACGLDDQDCKYACHEAQSIYKQRFPLPLTVPRWRCSARWQSW